MNIPLGCKFLKKASRFYYLIFQSKSMQRNKKLYEITSEHERDLILGSASSVADAIVIYKKKK